MATTPTPNPCDASLFSQVFSGNAIVCSKTFKDYQAQQEQEAIQSVADNAAAAYGSGSSIAQLTEATATQQEAQATSDVTNVSDAIANSKVGQIFTTCSDGSGGLSLPGLPCIKYKYLAYGAVALVVLYVAALVSSFVPRPR